MEQLNKVELVGTVGAVTIQHIGDGLSAHFSVATTISYGETGAGMAVHETTWHSVRYFYGKDAGAIPMISKGAHVRVKGRIRNCRYTAADGSDRVMTEITANSVTILDEERLETQHV